MIVDVISGAVADGAAFVAAIRGGLVAFERARLVERRTRLAAAQGTRIVEP